MEFRLSFIFIFTFIWNHVKGEGMIEVFKWKQIDYYNRGENNVRENNPNVDYNNDYSRPSYGNYGEDFGKIVFPDQWKNYRNIKREISKMTSRGNLTTNTRFGEQSLINNSDNTSYIAYNNVPMGATKYQNRLFVTMPRRRVGIPSTLNYIDLKKDGTQTSPKLYAYPNFAINQFNLNNPNASSLVSVYRTTVDECRRLWFIDTGMLEYPDNRIQLQRPSIWVIDLETDLLVHRFEIPEDIVDTGRGLASISVDVLPYRCGQAFAYLPDLVNNRLYVYSMENNRMWSFAHNYFNFDPLAGDLNVGGQSFRWDDGIFSTTLGPRQYNGSRNVYFHAMASNNEFVVPNHVLQNESNAQRSDHGNDFRFMGSRGLNKQSTMHVYDPRTNVIFYAEIQQNGVGCWQASKPFTPSNHDSVFQDAERMIYPSDLTIDEDGNIWVMSNSMPIFIYSNLDTNIYNFRIWKRNVFDAAKNTKCANFENK